jgi:hypothetical protein
LNLTVKPVIYNKALVVAFNFDSIEELQATSAIQSVCLSYFNHGESNRAWKASLFDHIYVTNDILTKGYVFKVANLRVISGARRPGIVAINI